ncbi:thiosulfate oxidation carrier protein SoxY [Phreatobacter sp.]|uniref:thiosulfate oxidation carrier protein SoxY n=1 Tax=Phreatobacter sp. TaxID=1966341 RepID=UPI003F719171
MAELDHQHRPVRLSRRAALAATAAAVAMPGRTMAQPATGQTFASVEASILAGRIPAASGIVLDMPPLSENGNSIDLTIAVDSPMNEEDHVSAIHVLSEKNPFPRVAVFHIGPRAGRAEVATRIRLAETQAVVVLAETSKGAVHRAAREVIVILGACVDGG